MRGRRKEAKKERTQRQIQISSERNPGRVVREKNQKDDSRFREYFARAIRGRISSWLDRRGKEKMEEMERKKSKKERNRVKEEKEEVEGEVLSRPECNRKGERNKRDAVSRGDE